MQTNPHQPLHAKTQEDINMEEGAYLESKYDENELIGINMEISWKPVGNGTTQQYLYNNY